MFVGRHSRGKSLLPLLQVCTNPLHNNIQCSINTLVIKNDLLLEQQINIARIPSIDNVLLFHLKIFMILIIATPRESRHLY